MAVFTLDEDYSLGSLDICLPDTFYAITKNISLYIRTASVANRNMGNKELHDFE